MATVVQVDKVKIIVFNQLSKNGLRNGAQKDIVRLKSSFGNIDKLFNDKFEIVRFGDLEICPSFEKDQILKKIDDILLLETTLEGLIIFVMAHGNENDDIVTKPGAQLSTEMVNIESDIVERLMGKNNLTNKPKIIIVNSCRGKKEDKLNKKTHQRMSSQKSSTNPIPEAKEKKSSSSISIPMTSDLFVFWSCYAGFYSYMDDEHGSEFIRHLCTAIDESSVTDTFLSIIQKTNYKVAEENIDNAYKQMPEFRATTRMDIFLKAGKFYPPPNYGSKDEFGYVTREFKNYVELALLEQKFESIILKVNHDDQSITFKIRKFHMTEIETEIDEILSKKTKKKSTIKHSFKKKILSYF